VSTLADSLIASSSRPLSLRARPDLVARRHRYQGNAYFVIKEPIGLQYFRFHPEEYFILQQLDGKTSLQQIKERFEAEFAPQKLSFGDMQQFIGMLHRSGLVLSSATGQGSELRKRRDQKKRQEWLSKLTNIFALRFRGVDPDRFLTALLPWFGWLFTIPALWCTLLLGAAALTLVGTHFETFQDKLPTFQEFFAARNWMFLALTMAAVKVVHELGHGLSCKKFGGECHEIGVMLLVFTPCLYCNVSDSWMLPNKWQRAWIGAAGMYVELIMASFAVFGWWFSEPGFFNFLCLAIVFICSVSTVMFNGNPLLRFDGYYILMDLLEIPNLRQKSTAVLTRWFQKSCLGLELTNDPFLPQRNRFLFGLFTVASVIYRWVVVFSIAFFLAKVLEPYGLQVIGRILALSGLVGLVVQPARATWKFIRTPGRLQKVKRAKALRAAAIFVAAVAAFCLVPFPHSIEAPFEVRPANARYVYAGTSGRIKEVHVRPGQSVHAGDLIVELENLQTEFEAVRLVGQVRAAEVRLDSLQQQAHLDADISGQEAAQQRVLATAEQLSMKAAEDFARLRVKAPTDGVVFEPPYRDEKPSTDGRLSSWSGFPLSPENLGAFVSAEDLLCMIGDQKRMEAILVIDQRDIQLIRNGMDTGMQLDSERLSPTTGQIDRISQMEMQYSPATLSSQAGGGVDTKADTEGGLRPISTSYQARVLLPEDATGLRAGYRGTAKIHTEWKSLGWRVWRWAVRTFNFEF